MRSRLGVIVGGSPKNRATVACRVLPGQARRDDDVERAGRVARGDGIDVEEDTA
jgi:hypothetical protein